MEGVERVYYDFLEGREVSSYGLLPTRCLCCVWTHHCVAKRKQHMCCVVLLLKYKRGGCLISGFCICLHGGGCCEYEREKKRYLPGYCSSSGFHSTALGSARRHLVSKQRPEFLVAMA